MRHLFNHRKNNMWRKITSGFVCLAFSSGLVFGPATGADAQYISNLPRPGEMVLLSPSFEPAVLKGMTIHPENPLQFDFIVDRGQERMANDELKRETEKLIKYFLAAMTIPDDESWVNLSPYEGDRIIPDALGITDMGKTMLEQDYLLKQLSASLTNPQEEIGKKFWETVYRKAYEKFGMTTVPINTFNKVWIIPETAVVLEDNGYVFVGESKLKVMLDEDYLSLKENLKNPQFGTDQVAQDKVEQLSAVSSQVVREIIIPELEKEINQGKNFAPVRQIYHSVILATWYKQSLKESLLGKIYVDKNKISGVDIEERDIKQKIYDQYLEAFRRGVYNLIKEDYDLASKEALPRKYFSGGFKTQIRDLRRVRGSSPLAEAFRREIAESSGSNQLVKVSTIAEERPAAGVVNAGVSQGSNRSVNTSSPVLNRQQAEELADTFLEDSNFRAALSEIPVSEYQVLGQIPDAELRELVAKTLMELAARLLDDPLSSTMTVQKVQILSADEVRLDNFRERGMQLLGRVMADRYIEWKSPDSDWAFFKGDEGWEVLEKLANRARSFYTPAQPPAVAAASAGSAVYQLAELKDNIMPIVFSEFRDPLVRQVLGNLIRDIVQQATDSTIRELYVSQADYEHDLRATEEFLNWILKDIGKKIDEKRLNGEINPQKASWLTWDNYQRGQVPPGSENDKVKITFFATSGNPIQLAHIGQMLNDIANNGTDFALIVLQGADARKPDLSPMDVRVGILEQSILRSLEPFIRLSRINEDGFGIDGEENVLRIARMNPGVNIEFNYLFGLDHFLRTTWKAKGLAALPEIIFQKDEIRSVLRLSGHFMTPGTMLQNEEMINKITEALVKIATREDAAQLFRNRTSLANALIDQGIPADVAGLFRRQVDYQSIFGRLRLDNLLSRLRGEQSGVYILGLLNREDDFTPAQRQAIAEALVTLAPVDFSSLGNLEKALRQTDLVKLPAGEELIEKLASKKTLERFFNAVPILDTVARFENARVNEVIIKGETEPFQYPDTLNIRLVVLDRAGETNRKDIEGLVPGSFDIIGTTPGFGDAAATGIREKGRWLWATQGVMFASAEQTKKTGKSVIPSLSLVKAEGYLIRIQRKQYAEELIKRIARNETRFNLSREVDNSVALRLTPDDVKHVFTTVGLKQTPEDSGTWLLPERASSASVRVLVADDQPLNTMLAEAWLTRKGYEVVSVFDLQAARKAIEEAKAAGRPFAIALIDNNIPDPGVLKTVPQEGEGEHFLREFVAKADPSDPVLLLSTDDQGEGPLYATSRVASWIRENSEVGSRVAGAMGKVMSIDAVSQMEEMLKGKVELPGSASSSAAIGQATVLIVGIPSRLISGRLSAGLGQNGYNVVVQPDVVLARRQLADAELRADIILVGNPLENDATVQLAIKEAAGGGAQVYQFASNDNVAAVVDTITRQTPAYQQLFDGGVATPLRLASLKDGDSGEIDITFPNTPRKTMILEVKVDNVNGRERLSITPREEGDFELGLVSDLVNRDFWRSPDGTITKADNQSPEFRGVRFEVSANGKSLVFVSGSGAGVIDYSRLRQSQQGVAVASSAADAAPVGGIDFDPTLLNLQIKRNGKGVPLPLPQQNIESINIDGLYPVIINMQPATIQSFPFLLSSEADSRAPELSRR